MHDTADLSTLLANVYWLGGTSGAGKSTIARRIASAHDMILYSTDEAMRDHSNRCAPDECPRLEAFKHMSMDERWANRAPEVMYETFHWFHGEGFRFILENLLALPCDRKVIAEGFRLLPRLVKPAIASPRQAVWLISTPEFRVRAFTARGSLWKIPNKTAQPKKALENHLARESIFAERLKEEANAEGVTTIIVNGSHSEDELLDVVVSHFEIRSPLTQ